MRETGADTWIRRESGIDPQWQGLGHKDRNRDSDSERNRDRDRNRNRDRNIPTRTGIGSQGQRHG